MTSCLGSASRTISRQNLITIPGRRLARSIFLVPCLCLCWKNIIAISLRETTREMPNLRETRNCIAYAYRKGFINDREFCCMMRTGKKNPNFPYWNYERFELDGLTNAECNAEFRFYKNDMDADALQLLHQASSSLLQELQRFSNSPIAGTPMCLYGDPAYPLCAHIQGPFRGAALTQDQKTTIYSHEWCTQSF